MEGRGIAKFFAILLVLISVYQLSFTYVASGVEEAAQEAAYRKIPENVPGYAALRDSEKAKYLDSIGDLEVYSLGIAKFTYNEVKKKELNKGLDLKGGVNVILQISVKDVLRELTNNSKDPVFNRALIEADKAMKTSDQPYVELFFDAFERIDKNAKYASPTIFATKGLSSEINFQMSNSQAKSVIRKKVDESVLSAFEVLRKRIDKFGVTQPNIQRLGNTGRILVELPGAKDVIRIENLLKSTAQLEFWHAYKNTEVFPYLLRVDDKLRELTKTTSEKTETSENKTEIDSLVTSVDDSKSADNINGNEQPLIGLIRAQPMQGSPVLGNFAVKDTATVNAYLNRPAIKSIFTDGLQYVKFVWGKPEKSVTGVSLYALKYNRDGVAALTGGVITNAQQTYDIGNRPAVSMQMDTKGARIFEEMTREAFNNQSSIAIVLDNMVYSAPGVSSGPISGGNSEITGNFSLNEAIDLANVLKAGKLPASADIVQSEIVGPSLGQEAIDSGLISFVVAVAFVFLWMFFYYGAAGLLANAALTLNVIFIFGVLSSLGAVLTLPGVAGIVLTLGMAVDSNVIIYERIKEELALGKSQRKAVTDGFSNALSSIIDANITTALTAIVLLVFGTGPVKGFATTLLIGIVTSLFTAIVITRMFIEYCLKKQKPLLYSTRITRSILKNTSYKFLSKRKIAYAVSSVLIVISLISLFTRGLSQGVDFVGGRSYQIRFEKPMVPSEIASELYKEIGSAEVKTFGSPNQLKITTKYKINDDTPGVDQEIQQKLYKTLIPYLPEGITLDQFSRTDSDSDVGIMSSIKVGPTIADDIKTSAFWAVLGSIALIFVYILIRFKKWQFSLGAIAALAHDVIIVLGVFSLGYEYLPFNMEIDQAFIAAILTVVGYSVNDTVIVFDRIREIISPKGWKMDKSGDSIDTSLNATLSRTLNTSLTTLIVLFAIFLLGGDTLRGFVFAMIVGIGVGTYSSLFIATPIAFDTSSKEESKSRAVK